ncbi:MAG: ATP-binding cassette domain-containing protein [Candidatus Hadarchaeaceae archaeon]
MEITIDARRLTKIYGHGRTAVRALDDVSLHVVKGEVVLVMGPSGSGKTTLLQVMGTLLKPTWGSIRVNDVDITKLSEGELPKIRIKDFGFVFQSPNLLSSLTARENVEVALNLAGVKGEVAKARARKMLEKLGMGKRLNHRPEKLSGGEQQRVAIARALANDPATILADEPTANLDSKNGRMIMGLLRRIAKKEGKSIVVVSHDPRIKKFADRTLWLEDGRLSMKRSPGLAIDPVCKMLVDKKSSEHVSTFRKRRYYFCSERCKQEFQRKPARYF